MYLRVLVASFLFFGASLSVVDAAVLRVVPGRTSVPVGSTVSVSILVDSADQAMNAAAGTLQFSMDMLQVTSISKSGSVVGLWVQEPTFSNTAGTVNFEGVVLNPGYRGSSGVLVTVTFRAINEGTATFSFPSASILANDGNGTEILTAKSGGALTVTAAAPVPVEPAPVASSARIVITSPTHPDSEKAYRAETARFEWKNPAETEAVRILYDKNPATTPSVLYEPPISSKEVTPGPGTWYFHAQARTESGWGPVSHFKFTIDPLAPELDVVEEVPPPVQPQPEAPQPAPSLPVDLWQIANYLTLALAASTVLGSVAFTAVHVLRRLLSPRPTVSMEGLEAAHELHDARHAMSKALHKLKSLRSERLLSPEEIKMITALEKALSVLTGTHEHSGN